MPSRNPLEMFNSLLNPWFTLSSQAVLLGIEAQSVMAMRMMRLAAGGANGQAEAQRMVTEKVAAFAEAHAAAVAGVVAGSNGHHVAKKVLNVYGKRVRGNRRRLSR
ncbi:MAG TPA: hypothetical protein VH206_04865 [Xanthobacteraceae bacterium]|jgi:hypothetical protein|nr:hypothetical protein [Xanthobacteraceae bacterium]